MTSRLPWVAAALIIVAAVGVWAIWGAAPAQPTAQPTPTPTPTPTAAGWSSTSVLGLENAQKSGIVAVYIAKTGQDYDDNWDSVATTDNYYKKFSASGDTGNIPYMTAFYILISVVGHDDNMASVVKENLEVELTVAGDFAIAAENCVGAEQGAGTDGDKDNTHTSSATEIGINAIWDNTGAGFVIREAQSITWNVRFSTWA